ncbi:MAG: ribose ABC transporter permease [Nitrospiraceae bacterium]|nr:ribose ABC transporter permease [Nitrospiraceae bacterium]
MNWRDIKAITAKSTLEIVLVLTCIILSVTAPHFLSIENLLNVLRSVSVQGLLAFGMTMVIIAGEIDLSVASSVALAGCLVAYLTQAGIPLALGIPMTVLTGASFGVFTGVVRVKWEVPSFISTLALYLSLKGLALLITGGFPIASFPDWYHILGGGYVLGVPFPALIFLAVFAAIAFVMKRTVFGQAVYAVGGNAEAARLSGINVAFVRIMVFAITGALAAVSGIMLSARIMSGTPTVAVGWELDAIAAVIVGGTSFAGGIGTVWGTLVGVVFIGVIINGMTLLDVSSSHQFVMRGMLIFAAVWLNRLQEKRK